MENVTAWDVISFAINGGPSLLLSNIFLSPFPWLAVPIFVAIFSYHYSSYSFTYLTQNWCMILAEYTLFSSNKERIPSNLKKSTYEWKHSEYTYLTRTGGRFLSGVYIFSSNEESILCNLKKSTMTGFWKHSD